MKVIAKIYNDYDEKFGIPRQSGIVENESIIIFEPDYRVPEAFRGIEEFNYIWLIWEFSECKKSDWSPTVRPPKLGGNKRVGVFATRSPFRPNSIGLSSVKLIGVEKTEENGIILKVSGADLMNGTPIFDIKPYLNYADCHSDANNGFAFSERKLLNVEFEDKIKQLIPKDKFNELTDVLSSDPRPGYSDDPEREYGMSYGGLNVKFKVIGNNLIVTDCTKEQTNERY